MSVLKKYICDFNDCQKRFFDLSDLIKHKRIHTKLFR